MAGYRRVNYYELCRLCTSSEGTKLHIFREEGRRRQLPTKIQICLPVQICEDDSLPKIICNYCVEKLESFYDFRESCVNAESMLESYFTSLRYSDDFSREGKVYVKEKKKLADVEDVSKASDKVTLTDGSSDGLNSLVQAASIQVINDTNVSRIQQYKCTMQIQSDERSAPAVESTPSVKAVPTIETTPAMETTPALETTPAIETTPVMETTDTTTESRYTYEACEDSNPRLSDPSPSDPATTTVETHTANVEDGSTQCNEADFKNSNISRHHQTLAESGDEGEVTSQPQQPPEQQQQQQQEEQEQQASQQTRQQEEQEQQPQQLQPIAFATSVPAQEMLLHFSFKSDRDGVLRTDDQTALQRSSISQIGEFLRMKNSSIVDNGVQTSLIEVSANTLRPCIRCGKPFTSLEDLQNHSSCPLECDEMSPDKFNPNGGNISCEVCSKPFKRKEHLFQHRKLHTGERPYICTSCGKAFSRKEHLVRHTVSHTGQKVHACEMCGKSFSRKDNLHKHRKTHGIAGPYICEACGKSFVVKHNYIMHRSSHSSCAGSTVDDDVSVAVENPLPYKCDICNKRFAMKQYLTTHKQRHRNKGINAAVALPNMTSNISSSVQPVVSTTAPSQSAHSTSSLPSSDSSGASPSTNSTLGSLAASASSQQPSQQPPQQEQSPEVPAQQTSSVQLDGNVETHPLALTHTSPLTTLPSSPLLTPNLLHMSASGTPGTPANPTMATMIQVSSAAATAYLCTPTNDILETYRRLHST